MVNLKNKEKEMKFNIGEHVIVEKWGVCSDGFGFGWIIDIKTEDGKTLYYVQNTTDSEDHRTEWLEEGEIVSLKKSDSTEE